MTLWYVLLLMLSTALPFLMDNSMWCQSRNPFYESPTKTSKINLCCVYPQMNVPCSSVSEPF